MLYLLLNIKVKLFFYRYRYYSLHFYLDRELRQYSLAAVILEEWLHELAAIAQEQSVLQKEQVCHMGMEIPGQINC